MATMREVAARAGVSVATVSAVISGRKKVSPELSASVLQAMRELDYHPNALARALYTNRSNTIAFLVPSVENFGFSNALSAVERVASSHGYSVFVANTRSDPDLVEEQRQRLINMRVDGILIALTWELARPELVSSFKNHGVRVVGLSGGRTLEGIDCILADEEKGGFDLGRYLASLGHRQVAFVGPKESAVANLRFAGLQRALRQSGGDVPERLVSHAKSYDASGGSEAAMGLLASGEGFTCVVVFNDLMATGVMDVLVGQGLNVPNRVSVATFGNVFATITRPRLTTMVYDESHAGQLGAERLFERILGAEIEPLHKFIPMSLSVNESTRVVETQVHGAGQSRPN